MKTKKIVSILLAVIMLICVLPLRTDIIAASNEEIIFDYLIKEMNLNVAAACGVISNLACENSTFDPNIREGGTTGYGTYNDSTGYGICQWTYYTRKLDLYNWCNQNIGSGSWSTLDGQLRFMKHELEEQYGVTVLDKFKTIPNTIQGAYDAAYIFCYFYEQPYYYKSTYLRDGSTYESESAYRGIIAQNVYWKKYSATVVPIADNNHPYPALLDYSDLESDFENLCADKIQPMYHDYVLESIKYHIESEKDNYRVANNLMKTYNTDEDGNVMFFFDGCSVNLNGSTPCYSGFDKNGKRYNNSAVCIVIQVNSFGRAEIVFASKNASTMPDNVRNAQLNGGTPPGSLRDGIYNFISVIHNNKYAAFNIVTTENSHVRCCDYLPAYISRATKINIHRRGYSYEYITESTYNSTGCFNVGGTYNDQTEYNGFIKSITGYNNAGSGYEGYTLDKMYGIVIVDRSNYEKQLATVYGNDSNFEISGGWTGIQIASAITEGSDIWNTQVNERISALNQQDHITANSPLSIENENINGLSAGKTVAELISALNGGLLKVHNRYGAELSGSDTVGTGSIVTLMSSDGNVSDKKTVIVKGDTDGDGVISTTDYLQIKRYFQRKYVLTDIYLLAADCDGESGISTTDFLRIKRHFQKTFTLQ